MSEKERSGSSPDRSGSAPEGAGQGAPAEKRAAWRSLLALAGGIVLLIFFALLMVWVGSLVR